MHICLIWTLLVRSILGRFLLPYWDVSFVRLNRLDRVVPKFSAATPASESALQDRMLDNFPVAEGSSSVGESTSA
jgi:hypothetical protein